MTTATRRPPASSLRLRVGPVTAGAPLGISDAEARRFLCRLDHARRRGLSPSVVLVSEGALSGEQLAGLRRALADLLTEGE